MKRFLILLSIFTTPYAANSETLEEKAARIHETRQQGSESVVLGALDNSEMTFAVSGVMFENGPEPDPHTLYEIGSITKVFTAILLAEAVREGKASFDDPVGKFLPRSAIGKDSPLESTITLESLATHTSGLPRIPADLFDGADKENPYAHYDEKRLYAYLKTLTEQDLEKPGEFSYSNLGFGLLGHVLARIQDTPFAELATQKIFEPLGMKETIVPVSIDALPKEIKDRLAKGHNAGKEVSHWELGALAGAGAILSSAHDLLLFAKAHWDDATPSGLKASLQEVRKPRLESTGLAWFLSENEVSHGGGTGGFRTHLSINVAEKQAEVDLRNSSGEVMTREAVGDFTEIEGFWEGTLIAGKQKLRLVHYISRDGRFISFSIDQRCGFTEATATSYSNGSLTASFPTIGGRYEGKKEGDKLVGTWFQSGELPLVMSPAVGVPAPLKKGLSQKYPDDLSPVVGYWSGYLGGKDGIFIYLKVEPFEDQFLVQLFSPDQTPAPIPVTQMKMQKDEVRMAVIKVGGSFKGKLDRVGKTITGTWSQGKDMPLKLTWTEDQPARE
ncbi:MAG: serine hydrolase [Verrucomicrobiales bacterium]|nr:serine hydrolase [Verrucomicrobiales bacterium]